MSAIQQKWILAICLAYSVGGFATRLAAVDSVHIIRERDQTPIQFTGTIVEFNGQELTLQTVARRDRRIPTTTVESIVFDQSDGHRRAKSLRDNRMWKDAVDAYQHAFREERREWVQRRILRDLALCHRATGDRLMATEMFKRIVESDPETQYLDAMPLAWVTAELSQSEEKQALQWMADKNSRLWRLLGSSWLLSGSERPRAIQMLRQLVTMPDPRGASLAVAQLWRTQSVTATASDLRRWQRAIQDMEPPLRHGAVFVLAQAQSRDRSAVDLAVANFLRIPILYPEHDRLAAAALLSAGRILEREERTAEAQRVYRELVEQFKETESAAAARTSNVRKKEK